MARAARSLILVKLAQTPRTGGHDELEEAAAASALNAVPLGTLSEVVDALAEFNTASDGSADSMNVLHGPGMIVQLPFVGPRDDVAQLLVTLNEEDVAFPVLERICRTLRWKMMDPNTGRTFG